MSIKNSSNNSDRLVIRDGRLYKLNLVIDKTATDIHHIMAQKMRNQYNVQIPQNKKRIPRREHVDLNNYHRGLYTPREQILHDVKMCMEVLKYETARDLLEILNRPDPDFYISELLKGQKKKGEKNLKKSQKK